MLNLSQPNKNSNSYQHRKVVPAQIELQADQVVQQKWTKEGGQRSFTTRQLHDVL